MGYACPVCEVPQRDAEHLANHLAFTAMLHGDDHEAWLDEHAPAWGDASPVELAEVVAGHATEAAYDEVFEDTVHGHGEGDAHGRDQGHGHGHGGTDGHEAGRTSPGTATNAPGASAPEASGEATREVLREARELTRRMYEEESEGEGEGEGEEKHESEDGDGPAGTNADGVDDADDDA